MRERRYRLKSKREGQGGKRYRNIKRPIHHTKWYTGKNWHTIKVIKFPIQRESERRKGYVVFDRPISEGGRLV
jgi:hypothetical protein